MYDTRGAAETARDQLIELGVAEDAMSIRGVDGGETAASSTIAGEDRGFWASLSDLFMPVEDRHTYAEGLKRGGYLLSARVPDGLQEAAADILEASDPIDLDQRSETWRQAGWTGYDPATAANAPARAAYGEGAGLVEAGTAVANEMPRGATPQDYAEAAGAQRAIEPNDRAPDDDVIEVAEEQLRVGKREVEGGRVRVRSYVTERPVEEQVELRQEHVSIERRPVNRELAPGDVAFEERTIEAVERGEEAVVSKTARVTEEIDLRKDVEHATETVRDTVRKQKVEVEDERGPRRATETDTVATPNLADTNR
jgi:uncharacterized protein (TIGR02271 family)